MQARELLWPVTAAIVVGAVTLTVHAQTAPVHGKLISASTQLPAQSTATIYTTPASGHFILTQFCAGQFASLSTGTSGSIAVAGVSSQLASPPCVSFNPGFPLPAREKSNARTGARGRISVTSRGYSSRSIRAKNFGRSSFARSAFKGSSRGGWVAVVMDRAAEKLGEGGGLVIGEVERHDGVICSVVSAIWCSTGPITFSHPLG
jgi:hypothetical protein